MKRPAVGHILGYAALTIVLTAGAAQSLSGTDTVFTDDIKDGEVKTADIGTGQVFGSDIRDATVKSADVADDSLTGADINESTLAVPQFSRVAVGGGEVATELPDNATDVDVAQVLTGFAGTPGTSFVVIASLGFENNTSSSPEIDCDVYRASAPSVELASRTIQLAPANAGGSRQEMTLMAWAFTNNSSDASGRRVKVRCRTASSTVGEVLAQEPKIAAIATEAIESFIG